MPVELTVVVSDASPAESEEANNARTSVVEVTEHELVPSRELIPSLGGYGAQFNQHVYAAITSAPVESLPDLEAKVKALEPQFEQVPVTVRLLMVVPAAVTVMPEASVLPLRIWSGMVSGVLMRPRRPWRVSKLIFKMDVPLWSNPMFAEPSDSHKSRQRRL